MTDAILAIRPRALGDVVLTTPALRALVRGHPGAALDVATESRYAPLLEGLPGIDRVVPLDRGRGSLPRALTAVRRRRYRRVVDFFGNPRSALLTALSGARDTYGYDVRGRGLAYRHRVARDPGVAAGRREYAVDTHLRLAVAAGGVPDGRDARIQVSGAARGRANAVLGQAGVARPEATLGIVAAGSWGTKTWPASHAALLARGLMESGRPVLLLSGPGEEAVERVFARLAPGIAVLPACDVGTLAAVIERLCGVVGTDSGPRHLAAALGRPTFAWFGPTNPDNWTPPGSAHAVWWTEAPCRGCNRTVCPHWICLPQLTPQHAFELVRAHFDRHDLTPARLGPAAGA